MNPNDPTQPILPDAPEPTQSPQPVQPPVQSMEFVPPPPEAPVSAEQPIQMPPYAPATPPLTDPVMPMPPLEAPQPAAKKKKDVLGIISIVCIFLGMGLVGFILGLVGASHAKKEHRSAKLSRIGWVVNLVLMLVVIPVAVLLVMNNFKAAEIKTRDLERSEDLGEIEVGLEEYFNENFGYPDSLDDVVIPNEQALVAPNGSTIKVNVVVADEEEALASEDPSGSFEYTYTPYGKPTCQATCDGYVLKALIEKPTTGVANPLVKTGINNL